MRSLLLVVAGAICAALILSSPAPVAVEAAAPPVPARIDTLADVRVTPLAQYTDQSCTHVRVRLESQDGSRDVSLNLDALRFEFPEPDGE